MSMRILCIGVSDHIAVRTIICLVRCIPFLVFVQIVTAASLSSRLGFGEFFVCDEEPFLPAVH